MSHGQGGDSSGAGFRCPGSPCLNPFSVAPGTGVDYVRNLQMPRRTRLAFENLFLSSPPPLPVSLILQSDPRSSHHPAPLLGSAHSVKAVGSHFEYSAV